MLSHFQSVIRMHAAGLLSAAAAHVYQYWCECGIDAWVGAVTILAHKMAGIASPLSFVGSAAS